MCGSLKEVDPKERAILIIGKMGGGTVANIIPDTAVIEATLSSFNPDVVKEIVSEENIQIDEEPLAGTY